MSRAPSIDIVFQTPGPHPNGMQATAEGIWILDQQTNLLQLGFQVAKSFPAPGNRPHGLAWQGPDLWCVETNHRAFCRIDPNTGATLDQITLPEEAPEPHGMTIWDGRFWYCDANTGTVARFPLP